MNKLLLLLTVACAAITPRTFAETVAFWSFDEAVGVYPSSALADSSDHDCPLILGPGGTIVPGKFGHALSTTAQPPIEYPSGSVLFGLTQLPTPAGRTVPPLSWMNAKFTALITAGEKHLRKEVVQRNPSETGLNLGATDWTVEFWYQPGNAAEKSGDGVVFELGEGPRGENNHVTALLLNADRSGFTLVNQPRSLRLPIPSDATALRATGAWVHLAFVYDAAAHRLTHFVNGRPQPPVESVSIQALPVGAEAYFSVGRDGRWSHPLPGALDELRFSTGKLYAAAFAPPASFVTDAQAGAPARPPSVTEPLLFQPAHIADVVELGGRKHLLIDDALFPEHPGVEFVPNPPRDVQLAFEVKGSMRKHTVVVQDEQGLIRIYAPLGKQDRLGVFTSRDGLHFEAPKKTDIEPDYPNILTKESAGTPSVFIDPLAPPAERWKMVSGDDGSGIYVFTSPDGWTWKRLPIAALSARSGSQSNVFYDDQRGEYIGFHRSDSGTNSFGKTERRFVMTEVSSLRPPWPFHPLTQAQYLARQKVIGLHATLPWYLDNGPLTPGGVGIEYPLAFEPRKGFDPAGTDMYVPKATKYSGAPDTYLAFPCVYYHYEETTPETRSILGEPASRRGSGIIETQLMTSRDGTHWNRYPRPVWLDVGEPAGWDVHQTYMAQGVVVHGDDVWMYSFNDEAYHSDFRKKGPRRGVFRAVQRVDRFVGAQAGYAAAGTLYSRPLLFSGGKLELNVNTHASGVVQVGILEADGRPIPGYGVDDCVEVNGNELRYPVRWLQHGTDVSALAGRPVRLVIRLRGASLFALQFVP